jgi:CDP-glucose 4,6-dehydratase
MDWKDKNVLITGVTGFVGTWLAKDLVERGANVIGFVRDEIPNMPLRTMGVYDKLAAVAKGDIVDYNSIKRVFNEYEIDTCFHLAAQAIVTIARRDPRNTFKVNILGTWNVLDAAFKSFEKGSGPLKRIVIASTDKVYGNVPIPTGGIVEDTPLKVEYPYDASKVCVEKIAKTYFTTYDLPVAITRCCNIYGGGDRNFSRIIPGAIKSIIFNQNPVIRSDGTPVRDFIYVKDAVSAYITLAEKIETDPKVQGRPFNFGNGAGINMENLVEKIIKVSGREHLKPDIRGTKKPDAEIDEQYLSSKRAKQELGWQPQFNLETGLKETIKWYEDYFSKIG